MYSPYVGTDTVPTEVVPAVEETAGPSWFLVVSVNSLLRIVLL